MAWLVITTIAYFLVAFEVILDKFLITSKRVSHPVIYAFYSGLLSSFTLIIFFFGFHVINVSTAILSILAGMVFIYGVLALFFAIEKNEASQVTPVVGAVTTIVTYVISLLFLKEQLSTEHILGIFFLILGGLLISLNIFAQNKKRFFEGFSKSIIAGTLLAIAFTSFKHFYAHDKFINVFIWTRFGLLFGALSLLIVPAWRKIILKSFGGFRSPKSENYRSGSLFVLTKALGGTGSVLLQYAISLGSVTIVNALVALEYLFVFLLGLTFAMWFPKTFKEKRDVRIVIQKIVAIILITLGIALISLKRAYL